MFVSGPDHIYRAPALDRLSWLEHGFGTKRSAVPANLATLHQIHSAICVDTGGRTGQLGEGDALLTNAPGTMVAVKTADCVPILLVDEKRRAVAAVHAGWRGTVQEIAVRAVEAMREKFGTEPGDLLAAIGPAIGPCCYEVGPEVAERFGASGRARIDLPAANLDQLIRAGVPADRVYLSGLCTMCRADEFHSFRRDREAAGRMYSIIGLTPSRDRQEAGGL